MEKYVKYFIIVSEEDLKYSIVVEIKIQCHLVPFCDLFERLKFLKFMGYREIMKTSHWISSILRCP